MNCPKCGEPRDGAHPPDGCAPGNVAWLPENGLDRVEVAMWISANYGRWPKPDDRKRYSADAFTKAGRIIALVERAQGCECDDDESCDVCDCRKSREVQ